MNISTNADAEIRLPRVPDALPMKINLNHRCKILILLAILANSVGMFFPCLHSMFSPYYGSIAKHIAITNNWTDLVFEGHDWLDKPHFPFWITATSFKIFGINSFAYILPGFIFHLIGIYYTYRIARFWYSKEVGVLAALFTASAMHLMLSSIDVRAEAFLIGEIMGACYYWLKYDSETKLKYLLCGAIFTALAVMTKGIFVLITIVSGLVILWLYQKRLRNIVSFKWLIALGLSFVFIAPELIALYAQFDAQPDKVVFGMTHVSGIRWFFWDSQFGRFFNTGPIAVNHTQDMHYLFFVYTFFWAYLPWWPMFFAAIWLAIKSVIPNNNTPTTNFELGTHTKNTSASIFLFASFFITFIVFSVTKFQIDHYTNILFPFASIICANWLITIISGRHSIPESNKSESRTFSAPQSISTAETNFASESANIFSSEHGMLVNNSSITTKSKRPLIYWIETGIAILLLTLVTVLSCKVLSGIYLIAILGLVGIAIIFFLSITKSSWVLKTIAYPTIAISITFIFAMFVNGVEYAKYDAGYQMAKYLNQKSNIEVVGYQIDLLSLDFNSKNPFTLIPNPANTTVNSSQTVIALMRSSSGNLHKPIYLVTMLNNQDKILNLFPGSSVDRIFTGTSIETYLRNCTQKQQLEKKLDKYVIIAISNNKPK